MKRAVLPLFVLLIPVFLFGQRLETNGVDRFTKDRIIETSHERLASKTDIFIGFSPYVEINASISQINGYWYMPTALRNNVVLQYSESDGLTLLLDNDRSIDLNTAYSGIGDKEYFDPPINYTFNTSFELTPDVVAALRNHRVTAIRLRYYGGHIDFECSKKESQRLMKMINLIDTAPKTNTPLSI